ncbi:MAG: C40 family peptidase [Kineosporiaceae bacterium]|nr:C40 family peptidase [Kineosporiaceae bacterium]
MPDDAGRSAVQDLGGVAGLLADAANSAAVRGATRVAAQVRHADGHLVPGWRVSGSGIAVPVDPRLRGSVRAALDAIAFSTPGSYAADIRARLVNSFALLAIERTAALPLRRAPVPTPAPPTVTVVVVGSPTRGQRYAYQFVTAAKRESGTPVVWLVERTGYEIFGASLRHITDSAPGQVVWITPSNSLITALSRFPPHSIRRLVIYSHGYAGQVALRYDWGSVGAADYGLTTAEASAVSRKLFTAAADIDLESCQAGVRASGVTLAQALAGATGRPVKAWTGRTSYADVNAGTGGVRGSEYTLSWDVFREFWVRNWAAGEAPQRRVFMSAQRANMPAVVTPVVQRQAAPVPAGHQAVQRQPVVQTQTAAAITSQARSRGVAAEFFERHRNELLRLPGQPGEIRLLLEAIIEEKFTEADYSAYPIHGVPLTQRLFAARHKDKKPLPRVPVAEYENHRSQWPNFGITEADRDELKDIRSRLTYPLLRFVLPLATAAPTLSAKTLPGERIAAQAHRYLGVRYQRGGKWQESAEGSLDCSGLVREVFNDLALPSLAGSVATIRQSTALLVVQEARAGDLLFRKKVRNKGDEWTPVGIYIGGSKIIHAPYTGTVVRMDSYRVGEWQEVRRLKSAGPR